MLRAIVSFCLLFICSLTVNAQFQVQFQGGPKISYTQNTGINIHETVGKRSWQGGGYLGYKFGQKYIIESGLVLSRYDVVFHYTSDLSRKLGGDYVELYKAYSALQIPLRFKLNVLSDDLKFAIRPLVGALFILKNRHTLKPKTPFDIGPDEKGIYTIEENGQHVSVSFPDQRGGTYNTEYLFAVEGGIEGGYKINSKVEILSSITYQTGLEISDSYLMYYPNYVERNVNMDVVAASSKAEALNFNLGFAYTFGKRPQIP